MQVSGIDMVLDRNDGLVDAIVDGAKIDPERTYTLCVNDYTASQGDKYFGKTIDPLVETGLIDRDVLIAAVRKHPVINSKIEGRVIIK